jgi:hypothetical protein
MEDRSSFNLQSARECGAAVREAWVLWVSSVKHTMRGRTRGYSEEVENAVYKTPKRLLA